MDDLIGFLRARLAEDEHAARQAADFGGGIIGPAWRVSGSYRDDGGTYWHVVATATAGEHEQVVEIVGAGMDSGGGAHTQQVAEHAVRHDPARVVREVEAKRNLIDSAASARHDRDYWSAQPPSGSVELLKTVAAMEARWTAWHYVLTQLAASYVSHPDYRSELIVPA